MNILYKQFHRVKPSRKLEIPSSKAARSVNTRRTNLILYEFTGIWE